MAGKEFEEIQSHIAGRKLNILKGFREVDGSLPIPLSQLQEKFGKENIYTLEVLKGYTNEVIEKGTDADKLTAKDTLNSLVPVTVVNHRGVVETVYLQKGIINPKPVDKMDEDEDKSNLPADPADKVQEQTGAAPGGIKTPADHAKETSDEDLKKYLAENPDGEHAAHAKEELAKRTNGEGDDSESQIDFNDPDQVKMALDSSENKDAIISMSIEHGITIGQAMKMFEANAVDHSDTHAKIDDAQAALDALKEKTGHPGAGQSEGSDEEEGDEDEEGDDTPESTDELIDEHEDLVDTLESDSHEDDKEEAKKQKKELESYKDKKESEESGDDDEDEEESKKK